MVKVNVLFNFCICFLMEKNNFFCWGYNKILRYVEVGNFKWNGIGKREIW